MQISNLAVLATITLALATTPFVPAADGFGIGASAAFAKDKGGGNRGGNGGGNGGGRSGEGGNGGAKDRSAQTREAKASGAGRSAGKVGKTNFLTDALATISGKSQKADIKLRADKPKRNPRKTASPAAGETLEAVTTPASVPRTKPGLKPGTVKLAGLNSLNRNYHAYLNSADPRMTAIRAYAISYATYELTSGIDTVPTDVMLDDGALRAALEAAAKPGTVIDDATLTWAKELLGVGPAIGKIDEIREELAANAPVDPVIDPVTDPTTDPVTDPVVPEEVADEASLLPPDTSETSSLTP